MAKKHDHILKKRKKYPLGCDVDKEEIFDYPYLTDDATVNFIKKHGRIMIIIRGPNSTLKSFLSKMIVDRYPTAQLCCADHYFSKTFSPPDRNKENIKLSHRYCQEKVEAACLKNESPIVVQNTHIRRRELQDYLDFAALYNYTVIMAVTLYKFDVSPEILAAINPDGLNLSYFKFRLRQWEDAVPLFTGWFLCPDDINFILLSLKTTLSALLGDAKFCHAFDSYDNKDIWNYFECRRNLYCIAGYTYNSYLMKKYYLSDEVQENYGKSFMITIYGYLITLSGVMALIHIEENISNILLKEKKKDSEDAVLEQLSSLNLNSNTDKFKTTFPFDNINDTEATKTIQLEEWETEINDLTNCKLIHVAQKKSEPFDIRVIKKDYYKTLNFLPEDLLFTELEKEVYSSRLPNNEWLVKVPKKIKVATLFTGLYV